MSAATTILPPPTERNAVLRWLKQNLFGSWRDVLLTMLGIYILVSIVVPIGRWAFTEANWAVVTSNLQLILIGQYPIEQAWRIWVCVALLAFLIGLSWGVGARAQRRLGLALLALPPLFALFPNSLQSLPMLLALSVLGLIGYLAATTLASTLIRRVLTIGWVIYIPLCYLLIRGIDPVLPEVGSNLWGGLLLTLLLTAVGIVLSFPLGVLLALGRRSQLPVIRWFCVAYIEVIRGVPLITVLFMAQLVLPLFLPSGLEIDRVVRAMAGITLFSAAYVAENVRGGLQNIPRGQFEAADALGLSAYQKMTLVVLPQAIRTVMPILVGQFIGLFKDTSLVTIVSLLDLLGIANTVLAQPQFIGTQREVYFFIAVIYWVLSFVMSALSKRLELKRTTNAI
jgi:general L-amino acid transport system permease protein